MTLRHSADVSAADWIVQSSVGWGQLVAFGPPGFDAYGRLRYIPDPTWDGQSEGDADVPDEHPSDWSQARLCLDILRPFTSTPDTWNVCVWEGTGFDLPRAIFHSPMVEVPNRRYFLAQGTYAEVDAWETLFENGSEPVPAFVWPADRAWCFASDVDPHWAGIGGSTDSIDALVTSALDAVTADPADEQPTYC